MSKHLRKFFGSIERMECLLDLTMELMRCEMSGKTRRASVDDLTMPAVSATSSRRHSTVKQWSKKLSQQRLRDGLCPS